MKTKSKYDMAYNPEEYIFLRCNIFYKTRGCIDYYKWSRLSHTTGAFLYP